MIARGVLAIIALFLTAGCFSERSFPIRPNDCKLIEPVTPPRIETESVRPWLRRCHGALQDRLPSERDKPLLTEDLIEANGTPINVEQHFGEPFSAQHSLLTNFYGMMHTAQSSGAAPAIDKPAPPWPGFEDVWIPINAKFSLSGRIGFARDAAGQPIRTDCIVILPGLLGDLAVERTKQLAAAMTERRLHVLAIELRGFGQTEHRYPDIYYNFGVLETGDLLAVAEWLQAKPEVRRTGLLGFCWGANHALLAAWEDGRSDDHPSVSERQKQYIRPRTGQDHFQAGVMAFSPAITGTGHYEAGVIACSPCLRFENIIEECEHDWAMLQNPILCTLQDGIRFRMELKHHPEVSGNLRKLIEFEFARSEMNYPGAVEEGLTYLRFLPHRTKPAGDKLESCRMPVLIITAANDPLAPAQDVADLMAQTQNPNVAALVLPGGGHVGFAAYARSYFYSLILNFFDPQRGPAAALTEHAMQ